MTISERVYWGIFGLFPRQVFGGISTDLSKKQIRIKIEKYIATYGGRQSYVEENTRSEDYNLYGFIEYTFYDESFIHLSGIDCSCPNNPKGDVKAVAKKFGRMEIALLKVISINLPDRPQYYC
jgi:hypothetical protein